MQYLDGLELDLNTVDTVIKTGNAMADAILNSKISLARSKNIEVHVDAHIPVKLKMSELDLCVILGNLFDNAIEASMKLPEGGRMIRVYMDMKNTQLYISFTNFTATGKLEKVGRLFRTSKGKGHGFEGGRMIRVYMDMKNTQLYISFTNFTATGKLEKVGRLFRTSKGKGHGFGLIRIDAIVERLGGYLSRNSEEGAFTTEILIPQT